jgi:hypothetical protein
MTRQPTKPGPPEGLKVIHAGLWRTGTMSISRAYERLGYSVHHVSTTNPTKTPWVFVEHAAEAKWPSVPGVKAGRPLPTRAEWDATWGQYDILTDLVAPFVPELIALYPEAKVVIVQRDFDAWWKSMQDTILPTFLEEPRASIERFLGSALFGIRGGHAMRVILLGFFDVKTKADITKEIARAKFDAYYSRVRAMVPPERRLEYRLGDGWEPLCDFLGKGVPDEPFPRLNDTQGFYINKKKSGDQVIGTKLVESLPWMVGSLALFAAWMLYRYSSTVTSP